MQLDDAATILAHADFFAICNDEQRRLLAFASERQSFTAGGALFAEGEVPQGAHVLISGRIRIAPQGEGAGKPKDITMEGALIGAMALVLSKPRPVTVTALTPVETLFVPRQAFLKLAKQYPDLAERAADHIRMELSAYLGAITPLHGRMNKDEI
ncbi:MAG TPA: cyclic nucleotide-binding domain-containing protein [Devosiaceae bacterium]|jgi:CRP-like cAMP-binding protein